MTLQLSVYLSSPSVIPPQNENDIKRGKESGGQGSWMGSWLAGWRKLLSGAFLSMIIGSSFAPDRARAASSEVFAA